MQEIADEGGGTKLIVSDEIFREQQIICQKLETANHKTLYEADLKSTLGYRYVLIASFFRLQFVWQVHTLS